MATKRKKKVWPKIKPGNATASEILAAVGATQADIRQAEAALRAVERRRHLSAVAAARTRAANRAGRSSKPSAMSK